MGNQARNEPSESGYYDVSRETVHALSNAVQIISGYTQLLLDGEEILQKTRNTLELIEKQSFRVKEILDTIRTRPQESLSEEPHGESKS